MNETEAHRFEHHPHFDAAVRLRNYDDMAKAKGMHAAGLDSYRAMLETLVEPQVLAGELYERAIA